MTWLRRGATALVSGFLIVGCQAGDGSHSGISATTSANNAAVARAPGKYRDRYPADVQAALAHYDQQRAIDPCGLVSQEQLSKYGKVQHIGGGWNADTCYIKYDVPKGANVIKEIDIGRRSSDLRTQLGERRDSYSCTYKADNKFTYPDGMPDLIYVVVSLAQTGRADEVSTVCPIAQELATQAVSQTRPGPQRKDSRMVPIDNLATLDPCQPIEALGDRPIEIGNWGLPFECVFQNRGNSQLRGITTIRLEYTPLQLAPQPKLLKPGLIKIDGVQVKVREDEISCEYTAYVGDDDPGSGLDDPVPEQWVSVVSVDAPRVDGSCADARTLTEKAISLYQQR
ncbi:hypothetical protein [Mycobacteroides abscessus]|uniref:hypothetical protein n=1 Tax=Mycobacteroides abscessus TaxID=36809 RepID=UPI00092AB70B|nr:hypothetical protein [Mycobacteroides abscessus]SIE16825.1 Uncharacterised protein [Mycobacteroides abscessus subsp. abscessus]